MGISTPYTLSFSRILLSHPSPSHTNRSSFEMHQKNAVWNLNFSNACVTLNTSRITLNFPVRSRTRCETRFQNLGLSDFGKKYFAYQTAHMITSRTTCTGLLDVFHVEQILCHLRCEQNCWKTEGRYVCVCIENFQNKFSPFGEALIHWENIF